MAKVVVLRYESPWELWQDLEGGLRRFHADEKNITKSLATSLPGLRNFYMCGQWLSPGGGLPPFAQSAKG